MAAVGEVTIRVTEMEPVLALLKAAFDFEDEVDRWGFGSVTLLEESHEKFRDLLKHFKRPA